MKPEGFLGLVLVIVPALIFAPPVGLILAGYAGWTYCNRGTI